MPYYYFEAITVTGHTQKKVLKARDKKEADKRLRNSGLQPILIENAHVAKKKKQAKKVQTRRTFRNTLLTVASVSLVGGIAAYLMMLDVGSPDKFKSKTLARSGIVAHSTNIINAKTREEREFAREMFGIWEMAFPDSVSGIEINHKGLMLLYVKEGKGDFNKDDLRFQAESMVRALQRRFEASNCIVLVVRGEKTLAEAKFRKKKVEVTVY
jgi:hypothetical protein